MHTTRAAASHEAIGSPGQLARSRPVVRLSELVTERWISVLSVGLVVVAGIIPRLNHISKSLWTSEAWVVNSALAGTLHQVFHYDAWLQTTPPLFLLSVRGAVRAFGLSTFTLRALPFVFSVLALAFLAMLSRKILSTPFAVLCTALLALCPPAVVFAKEVKQYSGDLAATCLLLLLCWMYLRSPDRRRYLLLIAGLALSLFLSYPAVCFVPLVLWTIFTADASPPAEPRSRVIRLSVAASLAGLIGALNYWIFIRPNTAPQLAQFWAEGYPPFGSLKGVIHFYAEYFMGMAISFYVPSQSKEEAQAFLSAAGHAPLIVLAICCFAALWIAAPVLRTRKLYRDALVLCFLPMLALAGINLLRLYPVSGRRLTLFIFPCIALMTAVLLQAIWQRLIVEADVDSSGALGAFLTASCVLVVFVAGVHANEWANFPPEDEDVAGLFQYVKGQAHQDDVVYVHASLAEPAKLYFRMLRWQPAHAYFGQTGFPCCTRQVEVRPAAADALHDYVIADIRRSQIDTPRYQSAWLAFTARDQHWANLIDERQIIARYLQEQGCRQEEHKFFTNVEVMQFVCRVNASSSPGATGMISRGPQGARFPSD